jgi:transcriptional regulator with XRE-family HTH domain
MSLQITITDKERAAGRFVSRVRRALQKALAEERAKTGITQSDIARKIGVNRSVISREIRGHKDLTLSRVAEIASALGRRPSFELLEVMTQQGANVPLATASGSSIPVGTLLISSTGSAANNNSPPLVKVLAS